MTSGNPPTVSLLVCAYDMARELPRTLQTLSRDYQRGVDGLDWEIVVLDNGSTPPIDEAALRTITPNLRVIRPDEPQPSPIRAINAAMRALRGNLLGLWIDGARLASPGILARAVEAWSADSTRVIGTLAFHLGPDVQMRTVFEGYDAAREDALLASVPWQQDGYRLFEIAALAGSSAAGWFGCINETNGLFIDRALWNALGGLDERFEAPGGGFANLDLWERAVAASSHRPWMVLGEGTFHPVHGGVATNGEAQALEAMHAEYVAIRDRPFAIPAYRPQFVGSLTPASFQAGTARPLDRLRHVHAVRGRHFRCGIEGVQLERIQAGTLRTRYRGLRLAKTPFDLALYLRLLERLRPATIIEIGTSEGGSAAWLMDQCRALGLSGARVITIDIAPPDLNLSGIAFHRGDANDPEGSFPTEAIRAAPHPWLVSEDSAHTYPSTSATLNYFDRLLEPGDAIVVEDGTVADLDDEVYRQRDDGPNRAVKEFLAATGDRYEIDVELCDFYGPNVTYAPNAWLKRVR